MSYETDWERHWKLKSVQSWAKGIEGEVKKKVDNEAKLRKALEIAVEALSVGTDWGFAEVKVDTPEEWSLVYEDDMVSIYDLMKKFEEILDDCIQER